MTCRERECGERKKERYQEKEKKRENEETRINKEKGGRKRKKMYIYREKREGKI